MSPDTGNELPDGLTIEALQLWRGERRLVANLSCRARPGRVVHVAGRNGSGKTTLLRAVCGLTRAERGLIRWRGEDIHADLAGFHRHLAWLGHRDGLKPELSVIENIRLQRRLRGERAALNEKALERAGILELIGLPVRSLSAGQKRRVALVRVFASNAVLWVLDEPFANLDVDGRDWGLAEIRRHVDGGGICLLSTHLGFDDADVVELGEGV